MGNSIQHAVDFLKNDANNNNGYVGRVITFIIFIIIFILSWVYAVANGNTAIYIFLGVFWPMIIFIFVIDIRWLNNRLYHLISAFYVRKLGEASTRIDQFNDDNYSNWSIFGFSFWGVFGFLFLILITCVFAGLFISYTGSLPTSIGDNDIRLLYPGIGVFIGYSILLFMVFCLMIGLWMFMNREYKADINWENQLKKLGILDVDNAKLFKNFGEKDNAAALALLNTMVVNRNTIIPKIQARITAAETAIPYSIQFKYGILLLFIGIFFSFVVGISYSKTSLTDVPLGSIQQLPTIVAPPSTTPTPQLSMDLSPFFPPVVDQGDTDICQTYDVVYYIGSYYYAKTNLGTNITTSNYNDKALAKIYSDRYGIPSDTTNANLFNPLYNWLYSVSVAQATSNNRCSTGVFNQDPVDSTDAPDYEEIDPRQNYNIIKDISTTSSINNGIGCMTNLKSTAIAKVPTKYDNPKVNQTYTNNSKSLSEKYSGDSCPGSPVYSNVANTDKKYPFPNMKYNVLYYYNNTSSPNSTYMTVVNNTTTFSQNTFLPLIKAQLNAGIPLQCIISFNPTTQITNNPRDIFDSFYQRNTEVFPSVSSNCIVTRMTSANSPNKNNNAGHSMVIVGYSEDPNVNDQISYGGGVIKFINSWGTSWGTERGFLYMSYACFFKDYNSADNGIVQRINYIS